MSRLPRLRCAIYTRKSSEEGLEQDFNSLDAQREACEAYIRSQAELGWLVLRDRYDDGGYSGGTLERPALRRLLQDVGNRRLDIIVIYKIDRLTRSLMDFARLAELLDTHGVSFVSVTQQFNTITSMGRLMLNVLLSFAQFEREITGERIRDKIAASKKKGLWMGGFPPLGYNAVDRELVVDPAEAEVVRKIFQLYLDLGNVLTLQSAVHRLGFRTKSRPSLNGRNRGGRPLSRGHLYRILQNPVYIGQIRHRDQTYPGQHPAIIDAEAWERVQRQLAQNTQGHRRRVTACEPSLLAGLLRDTAGERLVPSHAVKQGRRYRYYIQEKLVRGARESNDGLRLPASETEVAVRNAVLDLLRSPQRLVTVLGVRLTAQQTVALTRTTRTWHDELAQADPATWIELVNWLIRQIDIHADALQIRLYRKAIVERLGLKVDDIGEEETSNLRVPITFRQRGNQMRLVIDGASGPAATTPDPVLLGILAKAIGWRGRIERGEAQSLKDIATTEKLTTSYVGRVLRLAYLAPDIIEAIVNGRQPVELSAQNLLYLHDLALDWAKQHEQLGFTDG